MDLKLTQFPSVDGSVRYDISNTNGLLDMVDGIKEIKNRLICNLSVYTGEMYTDPDFGTDYHHNVFGRDVTDTVVIDTLKASILGTRGVTGLESFLLAKESGTRTAILTAQVKTTQGEIDLTTPILT